MKFDAKTGSLSSAPTSATGHTYVVTAKGKTRQSTSTLHVDIQPTSAPAGTVTPTSQTLKGQVGQFTTSGPWKFHGNAGDVNYTLSPSAPPGLSFNAKTGELFGIPKQKVDKTYAVAIKGTSAEAKASLIVKITAPSSTPTPSASPSPTPAVVPTQQNVTGTVGTPLTSAPFAATGSPASPAITFGILPAPPAGMSFSAFNGVLSGTPATASSQSYRITASNGTLQASAVLGFTILAAQSAASGQSVAPPPAPPAPPAPLPTPTPTPTPTPSPTSTQVSCYNAAFGYARISLPPRCSALGNGWVRV